MLYFEYFYNFLLYIHYFFFIETKTNKKGMKMRGERKDTRETVQILRHTVKKTISIEFKLKQILFR